MFPKEFLCFNLQSLVPRICSKHIPRNILSKLSIQPLNFGYFRRKCVPKKHFIQVSPKKKDEPIAPLFMGGLQLSIHQIKWLSIG
jgi:hypothetical protein